MKDKVFFSTSSGQVVRNLGFGYDFSRPYYSTQVLSKRGRFAVSFSRLSPVLAVRTAISLSARGVYGWFGKVFEAFRIVISSAVV
jgi:hypothetical protein